MHNPSIGSSILRIAIPSPLWQSFDYLPPNNTVDIAQWQPGIRVHVPFGRRKVVGILLEVAEESQVAVHQLKPALESLDQKPVLPLSIIKLCQWVSHYYHAPLGEVMAMVLPKWLRSSRAQVDKLCSKQKLKPHSSVDISLSDLAVDFALNEAQQQAIAQITRVTGFRTFLLDGVTGSGKTEVYFHSMTKLLESGKQALILVPEIALTPQTVDRFQRRFSVPIALLHSGLTDRERAHSWLKSRDGEVSIVIGTRSAVFTPLANPGIIIVDEEHDVSFKQQSGLRYSARDLAVLRGQLEKIPVVLGSATPSLESLWNVKKQRYVHISLPRRAGKAQAPKVKVINVRGQRLVAGMSPAMIQTVERHLQQGNQVLLFLNRRGYAPLLMCHACGWVADCKNCDAHLVLHQNPLRLFCHHCGIHQSLFEVCERCQHHTLLKIGQGTERLEQMIIKRFSNHMVLRIDRDVTKTKGSLQQLLSQIHQQQADILIGTQMLAKGHHFPKLTLVAIVNMDAALFSTDFRAVERMAQLLVQVAGRAGRAELSGEVVIQTHHPDHPLLQLLLNRGYATLAEVLLSERKNAQLPPFAYFALLRAESPDREEAMEWLHQARTFLESQSQNGLGLLGPAPTVMERRANRYRAQLLLHSTQRNHLNILAGKLIHYLENKKRPRQLRWSLDVDPLEMN